MFVFMFLFLILLRICHISFTTPLNLDKFKITLISDYVQLENRPIAIVAHLCWKDKYLKRFIKEISKNIFIIGVTVMNLAPRKLQPFHPSHQILYLTDLHCNQSEKILLKANNLSLFAAPFRWFIFSNENSQLNILQRLNIFPSSDLLLATQLNDSSFNLFQPYKISANKDAVIMEKYGIWTSKRGIIDYRSTSILSKRRSNLQKSILRVTHVCLNNDTINHLNDYKYLDIDTPTKLNYILTNLVMEMLNTTVWERFVPSWGYPKPDGRTFSGMIGDLMENRTDMGGTAASFYRERSKVIKFVSSLTTVSTAFIFREPPLSYIHNLFALTFSIKTWICTILLMTLINSFLFISLAWEWKRNKKNGSNTEGRLEPKHGELIMVSVGAMCQQGSPREPKSASGRMAFFFFFIFFLYMYTAYSANIVVLLQSSSSAIKTAQDLLESPLKIGAADNIYIRYALQNGTNSMIREMYNKKKPEFLPITEGIAKVRHKQYAFMVETGVGYRIIQQTFFEYEKCGLFQIDASHNPGVWAITQMNSTYLEILKSAYFKLAERGIQSRENQIFYTRKPECDGQVHYFTSVGLMDVYFSFYILLIGMFMSIVIFLLEITMRRKNQKDKRDKKMFNQNFKKVK